jgi:snRNA-activating protein complex subunit 3
LRDPSAIDYSKPIFDWLRNSRGDALKKWECIITGELPQKQKAIVGDDVTGLQLPQFKAVNMHRNDRIQFCDLGFRLGAGYLYCHQVRFCLQCNYFFDGINIFVLHAFFFPKCCTW